jgi:hypothetical protein
LDGGGKDEGGGAQQMSVHAFFDWLAPHRGNKKKKKKNNYASAVPAWVAQVAGWRSSSRVNGHLLLWLDSCFAPPKSQQNTDP